MRARGTRESESGEARTVALIKLFIVYQRTNFEAFRSGIRLSVSQSLRRCIFSFKIKHTFSIFVFCSCLSDSPALSVDQRAEASRFYRTPRSTVRYATVHQCTLVCSSARRCTRSRRGSLSIGGDPSSRAAPGCRRRLKWNAKRPYVDAPGHGVSAGLHASL